MKWNYLLGAIAAIALPIATLSSCDEGSKDAASSRTAAEAKHHYAVAMTGVV